MEDLNSLRSAIQELEFTAVDQLPGVSTLRIATIRLFLSPPLCRVCRLPLSALGLLQLAMSFLSLSIAEL